MKIVFVFVVGVTLFLNSCSALMDGKFVTKDGKTSPFSVQHKDPYSPPKDPTQRY